MDKSIFTVKAQQPTTPDLKKALGKLFNQWETIVHYVLEAYPGAQQEWNFPGEKYGWSFRLKDKKRVIVYLLPRDHYFKAAFVFGGKAFDAVMSSSVAESIKEELRQAKPYAEGRGIRIDVNDSKVVDDIKKLVAIKLAH